MSQTLEKGAQLETAVAAVPVKAADVDLSETPKAHPMYDQMTALKAEFPNSLKSIESAIAEAEVEGHTDFYPSYEGNPFDEC